MMKSDDGSDDYECESDADSPTSVAADHCEQDYENEDVDDDDDDDRFDDPPLPIPYSSSAISRCAIVRQETQSGVSYPQRSRMMDYADLLDDRQGMNNSDDNQFTKAEKATNSRTSLDGSIASEQPKLSGAASAAGKDSSISLSPNSGRANSRDQLKQSQRRSKSPSSSSCVSRAVGGRGRHSRRGFLGLVSRLKLTRKHESIAKLQLSILNSGFVPFKSLDRDLQTFLPKERMSLKEFEERVKLMRRYQVLSSIEYRFASRYETYVCRHATRENNQPKNNSKKSIPYDYNRVVLKTLPSVADSDYINASHVDSQLKPNAYIAAQGPNENTVEDFWRMIWEQKTFVIVMLTKVFDFIRVMCNQYWPVEVNKPERYGNLEVTLLYEEPLADFVIRTIRIRKLRGDKTAAAGGPSTTTAAAAAPATAATDGSHNSSGQQQQRPQNGDMRTMTSSPALRCQRRYDDDDDLEDIEDIECPTDDDDDDELFGEGDEFWGEEEEEDGEILLNVDGERRGGDSLLLPAVRSPKYVLSTSGGWQARRLEREQQQRRRRTRRANSAGGGRRSAAGATSIATATANGPESGDRGRNLFLQAVAAVGPRGRSASAGRAPSEWSTAAQSRPRTAEPNEFLLHPSLFAPHPSGSTPGTPSSARAPSSAGLDRSSATRKAVKKKRRETKKNQRPARTQFQAPNEAQLADDDDDDDDDDYDYDDNDDQCRDDDDYDYDVHGEMSNDNQRAEAIGHLGLNSGEDRGRNSGVRSSLSRPEQEVRNRSRGNRQEQHVLRQRRKQQAREQKQQASSERVVYQFHYHSWASHTCPFISSLLHFRRRVRICMDEMSKSGRTGPTVVHCNDGCGRTGTYLCVDANLELAEEDNVYDVYHYTKKLRQSRRLLIENLEQYKFVYDAIEEAIFCGRTWFPVSELHKRLKHKSQRHPITRKNEYLVEYDKITRMTSKFSIGDCAGGHRVENREKNRDVSTVPPDNFRPYLTSFQSNDNTDYINAVFVDGYTRSKEYIVTEWPSYKTISDFWSLVYDHDCNSVILLANPVESSTYPSFLPTEKELRRKFGPVFSAEMVSYTHYQNIKSWIYTINKRIVSLTEVIAGVKSEAKTTQVFQITCWPQSHRVPTSTNALVELMNMVERWRQRTTYGPVCVVSLNGKSRAGVYCAANVAIEQVVQHSEVDVFQAVKTVRRHRPQLIENMTEYKYCYDLILHYVSNYVHQTQPAV